MTRQIDRSIALIQTVLAKAKEGPLEEGSAARLIATMCEAVLVAISSNVPLPERDRSPMVDLYGAEDFVGSVPRPEPWSNIIVMNGTLFSYEESENRFIETVPHIVSIRRAASSNFKV